jgi:hypothetical protein
MRISVQLIIRNEGEMTFILKFLPEKNWMIKKRKMPMKAIVSPYTTELKRVNCPRNRRSNARSTFRFKIRRATSPLKKRPLKSELTRTFKNFIDKNLTRFRSTVNHCSRSNSKI